MGYYTPKIEEFHVGFYFEYDNGKEWMMTQFETSHPLNEIQLDINEGKIRVAKLSHRDIIDLGFERNELYDSIYVFTNDKLTIKEALGFIHIYKQTLYDKSFPSFMGHIKNKSELIKILNIISRND